MPRLIFARLGGTVKAATHLTTLETVDLKSL